jgi:EmrB/QacA subfamily drug resistance transporter
MTAVQPSPGIVLTASGRRTAALLKWRDLAPTSRVMVVATTVSMVAFLDVTVVNLALPATARDLGGGLSLQQWVVDGYLLAQAAMILPGGSLSDLFGRVPVIRFGLLAFGTGSLLAASAGSPAMLIAARVIQGLGAAFLVPGCLALINSTFDRAARAAAIGSWTAWTGTAFALGPLLGGLAVDFLSWRWIYALSAVPMVIGFALTFWLRPVQPPDSRPRRHARLDVAGAALSAVGLAGTVYALIESRDHGWADPRVITSLVTGVVTLLAFVAWQRRAAHPLVPPSLFSIRNFAGASVTSAFVYGAGAMGVLTISLYTQEVAGYGATVAGLATLPTPVMSFLLAKRVGGLATRIGPRIFLIAGPALAGLGLLLIRPGHGFNFVTHLLPGTIVLAIGMALTLTPLAAANLASVEPARSGVAAAMLNVVGRTSALSSVACVGLIANGMLTDASFARLLQVAAALYVIGALVSGFFVKNPISPAEPLPAFAKAV